MNHGSRARNGPAVLLIDQHVVSRGLAKERKEELVWFWIGRHDKYEQSLKTL
jgi:hypothetical protein